MQLACSWLSRQHIRTACISLSIENCNSQSLYPLSGDCSLSPQLFIDLIRMEFLRVECAADPFHPFLMLGMVGILDDFQQVAVAPSSPSRDRGDRQMPTLSILDCAENQLLQQELVFIGSPLMAADITANGRGIARRPDGA
jgi:hypothetical protein